jgi:hypothetical protein
LLHFILEWRPGDCSLQHHNKCSNLLHGSFFTHETFTATFEAYEAPFFQREIVLKVPGRTLLRENAEITPEEFVAEEDFHCGNRK